MMIAQAGHGIANAVTALKTAYSNLCQFFR